MTADFTPLVSITDFDWVGLGKCEDEDEKEEGQGVKLFPIVPL